MVDGKTLLQPRLIKKKERVMKRLMLVSSVYLLLMSIASFAKLEALEVVYNNNEEKIGLEEPYRDRKLLSSACADVKKIRLLFFDDNDDKGQERFFNMLRQQGTSLPASVDNPMVEGWPKDEVVTALKWFGSKAIGVSKTVTGHVLKYYEVVVPSNILSTAFGVVDALFRSAANCLSYLYDKGVEYYWTLHAVTLDRTNDKSRKTSITFKDGIRKVFMAVVEHGGNEEVLGQWKIPQPAPAYISSVKSGKFGITTLPVRTRLLSGRIRQPNGYQDYELGRPDWSRTVNGKSWVTFGEPANPDTQVWPKVDWGHSAFLTQF